MQFAFEFKEKNFYNKTVNEIATLPLVARNDQRRGFFIISIDMENRKLNLLVKSLKNYNPEKIILFGSAARKETDEYSDLDLVIIKKTDKQFLQRLVEVVDFVPLHSPPVDLLVYTPEEFERMKEDDNPFIEQVVKDGKVIYEKS